MASITLRASSYQVQIRRKDAPNLSKCFKSLTEAKAWARQAEAAIDSGNSSFVRVRNSLTPTLGEALSRYMAEILDSKKCAAKEVSFIFRLRQHRIASKQLCNITPQDAAKYRDELLHAGLANASVVRHLAVLSHVFTIAIKEWGSDCSNPVLKIRKPRVSNARSRRPSSDELRTVISHIATEEMRCFIQLAAETALRRSELFGLIWANVDIESRFVFLPDTKNGSSRSVVISSHAAALFATLEGFKAPLKRVFSFTHEDTPSKAFKRAVGLSRAAYEAQCNIEKKVPSPGYLQDLRLHDLRHEATSSLFERGLSSMEVASITGHKTLAMLHRYTHLSAAHLQAKLG